MSAGQPSSLDLDALDLNPKALEGLTVVITGTLPNLSRKQAQELVERAGGKVTGSISSKTNLLVAGDKAGSKLKKAEELGVEVLDEDELIMSICQSGPTEEEVHDSIDEYKAEGISESKEFLNSPLGKLFTKLNKQRVRIHADIKEDLRDGLNYMYSGDRKGAWICFHEMDYSDLLESNTCHIAFGISDPESLLNDQDKLNYYNKDKKRFFGWDEDEFNAVVEKATKAPIDDEKEYPDIAKIALVDHYIDSKESNINNILFDLDCIEKTRGNDLAVRDLGKLIVNLLEEEGIQCEWDKDPKKRIMIELNYSQSDYAENSNVVQPKHYDDEINEGEVLSKLYLDLEGSVYSEGLINSPLGNAFAALNKIGIRAIANCGLSLRDGSAVITSDGYKGPWVFFHEQDYGFLLESDSCALAYGMNIIDSNQVEISDNDKLKYYNNDKKRFFGWDEDVFNTIVEEATNAPIDDLKEYPDVAKIALVDHYIKVEGKINSILEELDKGSRVNGVETSEDQIIRDLGRRIVKLLDEEGIICEWDENVKKRIVIKTQYRQRHYMTFNELCTAAYRHAYGGFDENHEMINLVSNYIDEHLCLDTIEKFFNSGKSDFFKHVNQIFNHQDDGDDLLDQDEIWECMHLFCDEETIIRKLANLKKLKQEDIKFKKTVDPFFEIEQ